MKSKKPKRIEILENRQEELTRCLDRTVQLAGDKPILKGGNICYEVSEKSRAVGCGAQSSRILEFYRHLAALGLGVFRQSRRPGHTGMK